MSVGVYLNSDEMAALIGAPELVQRLYVFALRPTMCFNTGICGRASKISWHGLARELRVESAPGIKEVLPSRGQLRRACDHLVKRGLIKVLSEDLRLVLQCRLARLNTSAQNKASNMPADKADPKPSGVDMAQGVDSTGDNDSLDTSLDRLADSVQNVKPTHIGVSESNKTSLSAQGVDKSFRMSWTWVPFDQERLTDQLIMIGIDWERISAAVQEEIRVEFVGHWMAAGVKATSAQWDHRFFNSVKYAMQRGVKSGRAGRVLEGMQ